MSGPILPFNISIPESKIEGLRSKLAAAEFPDELLNSEWDLGSPLSDVKRLAKAWETFNWRRAEARLNGFPQFHTDIDVDRFGTLDVHFVHQTSSAKDAIPLLFVHGWPGSFIEVLKLLPLLADGEGPSFHVVAPSLPNYGFSQGVKNRGFALAQYAETCHKLMKKLGYEQYVTQGGDWGFYITRAIGLLYPESCKAGHFNMVRAAPPTYSQNPVLALQHSLHSYTKQELEGFKRTQWFAKEGRGYFMVQATKPQTLAYALHDSPVALLSWIYEKLHDWTDSYPWTDDEILTWVSIYQFSTAGPGAAHRIYYETTHPDAASARQHPHASREALEGYLGGVKWGMTFNPKELTVVPKLWGRTMGDIVYEAANEHGGHFYAHEHPELLKRDLKAMFGKGGGAYGVVKGRDGYGGVTARL